MEATLASGDLQTPLSILSQKRKQAVDVLHTHLELLPALWEGRLHDSIFSWVVLESEVVEETLESF